MLIAGCSLDLSGLPRVEDGGSELDGGGGTDAGCEPASETCNGLDDDCDREVDEDFDLMSDVAHCGACDAPCPASPSGAAAFCQAGTCMIACDDGFMNCDGDDENGCEASRTHPDSCGGCGTTCVAPTPLCQANPGGGHGCVDDCSAGTTLCGSSCIDLASDPEHCGDCETVCPAGVNAAAACSLSACTYACDSDYDDCDGAATAGCEQSLHTLEHCGTCTVTCGPAHATGTCATGSCGLDFCDDRWGDCNVDPADGCELALTSLTNCGACGTTCSVTRGTPTCAGATCAVESCDMGWGDCNSLGSDGCEADLTTDASHCGACGTTCMTTCTDGRCNDETTCDGLDDNGNGVIDEGGVCPCPTAHRGGHTYLFCTTRRYWTSARDWCRGRGYDLITIEDTAENSWAATEADSHRTDDTWWMGYNDRGSEGTWRWSSGSSASYTEWAPTEPNNRYGEDCGEFAGSRDERWNDADCGNSNYSICEAP